MFACCKPDHLKPTDQGITVLRNIGRDRYLSILEIFENAPFPSQKVGAFLFHSGIYAKIPHTSNCYADLVRNYLPTCTFSQAKTTAAHWEKKYEDFRDDGALDFATYALEQRLAVHPDTFDTFFQNALIASAERSCVEELKCLADFFTKYPHITLSTNRIRPLLFEIDPVSYAISIVTLAEYFPTLILDIRYSFNIFHRLASLEQFDLISHILRTLPATTAAHLLSMISDHADLECGLAPLHRIASSKESAPCFEYAISIDPSLLTCVGDTTNSKSIAEIAAATNKKACVIKAFKERPTMLLNFPSGSRNPLLLYDELFFIAKSHLSTDDFEKLLLHGVGKNTTLLHLALENNRPALFSALLNHTKEPLPADILSHIPSSSSPQEIAENFFKDAALTEAFQTLKPSDYGKSHITKVLQFLPKPASITKGTPPFDTPLAHAIRHCNLSGIEFLASIFNENELLEMLTYHTDGVFSLIELLFRHIHTPHAPKALRCLLKHLPHLLEHSYSASLSLIHLLCPHLSIDAYKELIPVPAFLNALNPRDKNQKTAKDYLPIEVRSCSSPWAMEDLPGTPIY